MCYCSDFEDDDDSELNDFDSTHCRLLFLNHLILNHHHPQNQNSNTQHINTHTINSINVTHAEHIPLYLFAEMHHHLLPHLTLISFLV